MPEILVLRRHVGARFNGTTNINILQSAAKHKAGGRFCSTAFDAEEQSGLIVPGLSCGAG